MKKTVLSFIIAILIFVYSATGFAASVAKAQGVSPWYSQPINEWFIKVYDPKVSAPTEIFGERYTAAQVNWVIWGLTSFVLTGGGNKTLTEIWGCGFTGELTNCAKAAVDTLFGELKTLISSNNSGFSAIANISQRPVSGVYYVKNTLSHLHLIPEAQAQTSGGFGFSASNFALELWKITRDIAYALLALVMIIMAFMIMFRIKISPQVVITVQSALPKIILALILITFSYAIAGFLIDLMYVVVGLLASFLTMNKTMTGYNWSDMYNALTNTSILILLIGYWLGFLIAIIFNLIVPIVLATITTQSVFLAIFLVVAVVILLILLWISIKIFLLMLKTFVNILFLIILAPLQILAGTVISGMGFGSWLRSMLSNLLVYPTVGFLLFMAFFFLKQASLGPTFMWAFNVKGVLPDSLWSPPLSGGAGSNYLGGRGLMFMGVSWVIISLIPKAADMIKSAMAGKEFGYGSAVGEALGPVAGATKGYGIYAAGQLQQNVLPKGLEKIFEKTSEETKISLGKMLEFMIKSGH